MTPSDLDRFSKAVLLLHDCQSAADLGPTLLRAISALVASEKPVVNSFDSRRLNVQVEDEQMSEDLFRVFNSNVQQHPLFPIIDADRNAPAVGRWSDFTVLRNFRQTALYHDFFRPVGIRHQLASRLDMAGGTWMSLVFNRSGSDFQKKDVMLVEQFLPHVEKLVQRLINRMDVEDALALSEMAAATEAIMILSGSGSLLYATERARRLTFDYFPEIDSSGAPLELLRWLQRKPSAGDTLTCQREHGRLTFTCGPAAPWSGSEKSRLLGAEGCADVLRCVRLTEYRPDRIQLFSTRFNLTPRENEVLRWMVEGKRNGEIAVIIGCSRRTVDKHCENIFGKLGVETRTAAASVVAEMLTQTKS